MKKSKTQCQIMRNAQMKVKTNRESGVWAIYPEKALLRPVGLEQGFEDTPRSSLWKKIKDRKVGQREVGETEGWSLGEVGP